ncbi:MAG: hypothetical protein AB7R89_07280 [Dehalococcoidia bacterium]
MRLYVQRFWCPKRGSTDREYEDAIAFNPGTGTGRRLAVADGASESSFARLWANLLVDAYVSGDLVAGTLTDQLRPLQQRWSAEVAAKPLPWYASEKARTGAFAALAGLTLCRGGIWRSLAAGDCCVLHVRQDQLLTSFPMESTAAFDSHPRLLSSNPDRNQGLDQFVHAACGRWQPGDSFFLMTDALAAYVLRRAIDAGDSVEAALPFRRPAGFKRWVEERRDERSLRNDDISLLRVRVI